MAKSFEEGFSKIRFNHFFKNVSSLAICVEYFIIDEDFIALSRVRLNEEDRILRPRSHIFLILLMTLILI